VRPRERESHDSPRVRARKGKDGHYLTTGCVEEAAQGSALPAEGCPDLAILGVVPELSLSASAESRHAVRSSSCVY